LGAASDERTGQLYRRMKPHVRRGRVAKEKRIERAKARLAARSKQAA
jgi:hypothetical protein